MNFITGKEQYTHLVKFVWNAVKRMLICEEGEREKRREREEFCLSSPGRNDCARLLTCCLQPWQRRALNSVSAKNITSPCWQLMWNVISNCSRETVIYTHTYRHIYIFVHIIIIRLSLPVWPVARTNISFNLSHNGWSAKCKDACDAMNLRRCSQRECNVYLEAAVKERKKERDDDNITLQ